MGPVLRLQVGGLSSLLQASQWQPGVTALAEKGRGL